MGYLLDIYHEEIYPEKFDEKKKPVAYSKKEDGSIETIGHTEMAEGEKRALLEQRKVVQARFTIKENIGIAFISRLRDLLVKRVV